MLFAEVPLQNYEPYTSGSPTEFYISDTKGEENDNS
jgi:hypothetical protein